MSSTAPDASSTAVVDPTSQLDPRLVADCHVIGRLERATVLLHRSAAVGWLILVPDTEATDWHELDDAEHERTTHQIRALTLFASAWFDADKMNVAAIGNQVPQMHVHVVARRIDDICWPEPVWGNLPEDTAKYSASAVTALRDALVVQLRLKRVRAPA